MKINLATKNNDVKDNDPSGYGKFYTERKINKVNDEEKCIYNNGCLTQDHQCTLEPGQW